MRVVTVTPAGRRRNLEVLIPYLLRNRDLIDEHHFWLNTEDREDIEFIRRASGAWPGFLRVVPIPAGRPNGCLTIYRFYKLPEYCDPDTIFIRIDDDICWIADDCLTNLVRFRIDNPDFFILFANTVNNAICAFLHQRTGVLPYEDEILCDGLCAGNAWSDEDLTRLQHDLLLGRIESGQTEIYKRTFERWILLDVARDHHWRDGEPVWCEPGRCSVNFIAWFGRDFEPVRAAAARDDPLVVAEERFLSYDQPRASGRRNCIVGSALAAHFSFLSQAAFMYESGFLDRYRALARGIRY